jgi:hypothetical protein
MRKLANLPMKRTGLRPPLIARYVSRTKSGGCCHRKLRRAAHWFRPCGWRQERDQPAGDDGLSTFR